VAWLRQAFEQAYEKLYSFRLPEVDVEAVIWRLIATGPVAQRDSAPDFNAVRDKGTASRKGRFSGHVVDTPVYARRDVVLDQQIDGPAIIEERETTIIILPGWRATVDRTGCIMAVKR
jgi:N-methylhydantoinase A